MSKVNKSAIYQYNNRFYVKAFFEDGEELEEVSDISKRYGFPKYTIFSSDEQFIDIKYEKDPGCKLFIKEKRYALSRIASEWVYADVDVINKKIFNEYRKCTNIKQLAKLYSKYDWYLLYVI